MSRVQKRSVSGKILIYPTQLITLFLVYFFTARFGLSMDAVSSFATLIWLPSGIALTALILGGYRLWPAIFLAAFLASFNTGAPPLAALGIGLGNTLEAIIGTYLFRILNIKPTLGHLSDILKFLPIIPFSAALSASIGVLCLFLSGLVTQPLLYITWQAWLIGDMISMLIITPFILVWTKTFPRRLETSRTFEAIMLLLFILTVSILVFNVDIPVPVGSPSIRYIIFLPILWAALRFQQRGVVTTLLILSTFAISETILGHDPYEQSRLDQQLLFLQLFLAIITITALILAAIETERQNLEKRKDEFISLASHELKTPLTTIKAFTQVTTRFLSKNQVSKAQNMLGQVDEQILKLERLINDLLDLSKINAGNLAYQKEDFPLITLVQSTVHAMQTMTLTHTFSIDNKVANKEIIIYGDKDRISQVIINLLTNATKYSPRKKKITITMKTVKNEILVSVKDLGIGMSLQEQENLFQRYYRAHTPSEKIFPGLGMGLYLTNAIIHNHHGRIWVTSKKGKGSTFSFALPIAKLRAIPKKHQLKT